MRSLTVCASGGLWPSRGPQLIMNKSFVRGTAPVSRATSISDSALRRFSLGLELPPLSGLLRKRIVRSGLKSARIFSQPGCRQMKLWAQ